MAAIRRLQDTSGAEHLITTGKEAVKHPASLTETGDLYAVRLELHIAERDRFDRLLIKYL